MIFFGAKEFFSWFLISEMGVKMNSRIVAVDPEIEFLTKSLSKHADKRADKACRQRVSWEKDIFFQKFI